MRILANLVLLFVACIGCSRQGDIPEAKCLVFTTMNNHRITTWVNDEPVLVCDNVYNGYNQPFWPTLRKGENTVHFTAARLPASTTKVIADHGAAQQNDGSSVVKIVTGNLFSLKDVLEWKVTEDNQTSPRWTVQSPTGYRPSLEQFEDIGPADETMRAQIAAFLEKLKEALDKKDIASVGWQQSDVEFLAKEAGATSFDVKAIFEQEHYSTEVSAVSELNVVCGKKTALVYRPDGEKLFFAGRSPDATNEDGKLYYFLGHNVLYFVKKNGKLEALWTKNY